MTSEDSNSAHKKLCHKIYNEGVEIAVSLVDEPSLALYRIQENIRKTAPRISEERKKTLLFSEKLQGVTYDLDNSLAAISAFPKAQANLEETLKVLESCMVLQQNILADTRTRKYDQEVEIGIDVVTLLDNSP